MRFIELSEQQSRLQIDIGQLFDAYGEVQRHRAEIDYALVWKRLRGDRAQAEAVLQLLAERLPHYPLDPKVLKGLPIAARTPEIPENL